MEHTKNGFTVVYGNELIKKQPNEGLKGGGVGELKPSTRVKLKTKKKIVFVSVAETLRECVGDLVPSS